MTERTFWNTQAVPQPGQQCKTGVIQEHWERKDDPVTLPEKYTWSTCTIHQLFDFLDHHYIQDDEMVLEYSKDTLRWLMPPGDEFNIAVRDNKNKLIGFICGKPAEAVSDGKQMPVLFINLLCVHKKHRSKGLAPLLIQEVSRRAVLHGIFQAVYTAVTEIPTPIIKVKYYHRLLNVEKLRACGFFKTNRKDLKSIHVRGRSHMRAMEESDVPHVRRLLELYFAHFKLTMAPTEEYVRWLLPKNGVVHSYVSDEGDKFLSLYRVGYKYKATGLVLEQAYVMHALGDVLGDAAVLAKNEGYDLLNSLDIGDRDLEGNKFYPGNGHIHYYMYNWKTTDLGPGDVDLVLP